MKKAYYKKKFVKISVVCQNSKKCMENKFMKLESSISYFYPE